MGRLRELAGELRAPAGVPGPTITFTDFHAEEPADRYLRLDGWTKGVAFINGFNVGRYWSRGPQRTLYVPGPLIRAGRNELAVLELHGSTTTEVRFVPAPDLGPDEKSDERQRLARLGEPARGREQLACAASAGQGLRGQPRRGVPSYQQRLNLNFDGVRPPLDTLHEETARSGTQDGA